MSTSILDAGLEVSLVTKDRNGTVIETKTLFVSYASLLGLTAVVGAWTAAIMQWVVQK
jgi:hypothetical protein